MGLLDPPGLTRALAGSLYVPQGAGARSLAAKCAIGVNATVGFAGDSTGDKPYEYLTMGLAAFVKQFPRMNADYYQWDGTSAYAAVMPILSGISARTVVMRDDFTRTAADLAGSTPTTGGSAWTDTGTGAGDWSLNGNAAVATADATAGFLTNTVGTGDGELVTRVTLVNLDAPRFYVKWVDSSNYVRLSVETNSSGQIRLVLAKAIAGTITTIGQSEYFYNNPAVTTYDVTIRVVGTRVTASVNGQMVGGVLTSGNVTTLSAATKIALAGTNRGSASIDFIEWATVTAASSPGTVTIYNGSQSGSILTYQEGLIGTLFPSGVPMDTVVVNSGHNYSATTPSAYQTAIDSFITTLRTVQPTASIVIGSQNPKVSPAANIVEHAARCSSLADYCARKGYGYIPAFESFAQLKSVTSAYIQADGVHPTGQNDGGAGLQAAAMLSALNRTAGVNTVQGAELIRKSTFEWAAFNPTLLENQVAVDENGLKIGPGVWSSLLYIMDWSKIINAPAMGVAPDVQVFTAGGAWTKPAGISTVVVGGVGVGGPGGSGRRGAAASVRCGGGGGGAGAWVERRFRASDLSATESVTIGAAGTVGAAVTANDTDGNPGVIGGNSFFGTKARFGAGGPGLGGTALTGAAGAGGTGMVGGAAGGAASTTGGVGTQSGSGGGATGGGGGGGITAADVASAGGAGGAAQSSAGVNAAAGVVDTTVPQAGSSATIAGQPGNGGGGGAASKTTTAQTGGAGGNYGGGGGGGGASLNGNNSGAGGAGGPSIIVVTSW